MSDQEEPKIIIDTDWKASAQAEKERLAAQEQKAAAKAPGGPSAAGPNQAPEASFDELVKLLASQALMYMGAMPDPETGKAIVAPEYAKFHIDLLGTLEEKTKGNLSDDEEKFLTHLLYELRMQFVEISKAVAKAVEEGRVSSTGEVMPGADQLSG